MRAHSLHGKARCGAGAAWRCTIFSIHTVSDDSHCRTGGGGFKKTCRLKLSFAGQFKRKIKSACPGCRFKGHADLIFRLNCPANDNFSLHVFLKPPPSCSVNREP